MGNLRDHQRVDEMLKVLPELAGALAEAERWLSCRDQEKQLTGAVEGILIQAQRVLAQAHLDYRSKSENVLKVESAELAVNAVIMLFGGRAPTRSKRASKTLRLGKVLISVGPEGMPGDLSVVNVSDLAERERTTDREIERAFTDKGHVLFTIEEFKPLASWLKEEVLCGRAALPFHPAGSSLITPGEIRLSSRC